MMFLAAPAHAGTWQFACGAGSSGQATLQITDFFGVHRTQTTKWVPPGGANQPSLPANSLTLPGVSSGADNSSDAAGSAVWTEDANVTAVITATWTHGTGQTDANDPAPASVWLIETSSAGWSAEGSGSGAPVPGTGSASDGLSNPTDIPVISYDSNGLKNGESYNSKNAPVTTPPAHWFVQPVSGGTFTFPRTFKAHCVAKLPASATGGIINMSCGFGGYTVTVHAQPYNFRRIPGAGVIGKTNGIPNGEIDWAYAYSSTDGNIGDLTTCSWHEHLTYPGGQVGTQAAPNKYYPPSPPFGYPASGTGWFPNPDFGTDVSLVPSPAGSSPEIDDRTIVPAFLKPYVYGTYNTTQVFEFDDSKTGDQNVQIPGPDSGPFTIVRTVKYVDPTHYEYDVSKASVPNTLSLPD